MYLRTFLSAQAGQTLSAAETAHPRSLPSQMPHFLRRQGNVKKKKKSLGIKKKKIRGGHGTDHMMAFGTEQRRPLLPH